jgi:preprotein translocase subunit Sec63
MDDDKLRERLGNLSVKFHPRSGRDTLIKKLREVEEG